MFGAEVLKSATATRLTEQHIFATTRCRLENERSQATREAMHTGKAGYSNRHMRSHSDIAGDGGP
jgi:hypothetical protein